MAGKIGNGAAAVRAAFLLSAAASASAAFSGSVAWLETGAAFGGGAESYRMSAYAADGYGIISELAFPVGDPSFEVRAGFARMEQGAERVSAEASFSFRSVKRSDALTDSDWVDGAASDPFLWSRTESAGRGTDAGAEFSVRLSLVRFGALDLGAAAAYRFSYLERTAEGYSGWQYALDADGMPVGEAIPVESSADALIFRRTAHRIEAGTSLALGLPAGFRIEAGAGALFGYQSDFDDHLLREKRSTAEGFGFGAAARARLAWSPESGSRIRPRFSTEARAERFAVSTAQNQTGYGANEGFSLEGLGLRMDSLRWSISLSAGLEYFKK